jgi:hypothetical protein
MRATRTTALLAGLILTLGLASPAAGAQQTIPTSGADTLAAVVTGGREWVSDGVDHVRGWTAVYGTTGDQYAAGTSTIVANWNLDLATGNGTLWGTADIALSAFNGGWHSTWNAKFEGFVWSGQAVGHGYGDLEGWQSRLELQSTGPGTDAFWGFVFDPGD